MLKRELLYDLFSREPEGWAQWAKRGSMGPPRRKSSISAPVPSAHGSNKHPLQGGPTRQTGSTRQGTPDPTATNIITGPGGNRIFGNP